MTLKIVWNSFTVDATSTIGLHVEEEHKMEGTVMAQFDEIRVSTLVIWTYVHVS